MAEPPNKPPMAVPSWVAIVTFMMCWSLGGYLLLAQSGSGTADKSLLFVAVLLLLFPLLSFHGLIPVLVKRLGGGGSGAEDALNEARAALEKAEAEAKK